MRALPVILLGAALAGCATTKVSQLRLPNGTAAKTVKCASDSSECFAAAAQSCGGGSYQALASNSHAGGLGDDVIPGPVTWYAMTYVCGPSDGRLPEFPFGGSPVAMPNLMPTPTARTNCTTLGNTTNCTTR